MMSKLDDILISFGNSCADLRVRLDTGKRHSRLEPETFMARRQYEENQAKAAIQKHYISRAEVLEITEPIYQAAFNRGERDPVYVAMVELRQKLGADHE